MAKQTTTDAPGGVKGDQEQYQALLASNGANAEAFMTATESVMKGVTAMNQEVMSFGQRRLEENVECSKTLMQCKCLEDAFKVQCDFIETATKQYLEESNQLLKTMTEIAQTSWAPVQDRTKQALHDLAPE